MSTEPKITFSWKNYFRPIPSNLLALTEGVKGILITLAGASFFIENKDATIALLVSTGVIDYLSKFFARADKDYKKTITIEVPGESAGDTEVTITETKTE